MPRIPDALMRLLVVFAVLIGGALAVRAMLPRALKDTAYHVQSTVERESARPIQFAGSDVCADCHEESAVKKAGYHANLSCEACHGAARGHADNPMEIKPKLPRLREFCVRCHAYNQSRPTGFPQINPAAHNPLKPCVTCHNPHDPKPPSTPQECQACHAEIARMKALSAHVLLECTECHTTPVQHKIQPRIVKASIPTDRDFCGKCHSKTVQAKDTPKVEMATHGEKYLCWQCHYPHMPEAE
jgi:ribosomal protein S27AE